MSECLGGFCGHGQGRAKRVRMVALTVAPETRLSLWGGRSGRTARRSFPNSPANTAREPL